MLPVLTHPSIIYRDSFLDALNEFHVEGRNLDLEWPVVTADFESYVLDLLSRQSDPRPGRVPETIFWLVDLGGYIGRLSLRHHLTPSLLQFGGHIGYEIRPSRRQRGYGRLILRLGLLEARAIGLQRVLITCDDDNIASARIIEANGGQLENMVLLKGHHQPTRRYWIDLA